MTASDVAGPSPRLARRTYLLERAQRFPLPREEVFAFFADAGNLSAITPPFLKFHMVTSTPIDMRPGALIDYRLRLYGLPVRWTTLIEAFDPPASFADRQLRGPYRHWHHSHFFEEIAGGTLMRDVLRYRLPYGPLGRCTHALFVRRTLKRIFDYRARVLTERFGSMDTERRGTISHPD